MADSPLLNLAEAYYMVAKDLEHSARRQLETAEMLNRVADEYCAQNMRETQQSPQPGEQP